MNNDREEALSWQGAHWKAFFFQNFKLLEHNAKKRFAFDEQRADTAFNDVLEILERDDWARLRKYKGEAAPLTFLTSVFASALDDYSRKVFGRCRPVKWVTALDALFEQITQELKIASTLFKIYCCHEKSLSEALAQLGDDIKAKIAEPLDNFVHELKHDKKCLEWRSSTKILSNQYSHESISDDDSEVLAQEFEHLIAILFNPEAGKHVNNTQLQQFQRALALTPDELMIIRLKYQKNQSWREVGELLGEKPAKLRSTFEKQTLTRLRNAVSELGLSVQDLGQWLTEFKKDEKSYQTVRVYQDED